MQLRTWMRKWSAHSLLWFDRTYNRMNKLDELEASSRFDALIRAGMRPAPELRAVIDEVIASISQTMRAGEHLAAEEAGKSGFNCLQVSLADVAKNSAKVFVLGGRIMGSDVPTLLADASLNAAARQHMRTHLPNPLFLSQLLPEYARPLFQDADGRVTLAYELVETHVCAAADQFAGNMLTPYAHAVCYERGGVLADSPSAESQPTRKRCYDLYSREEAALKASRTGRGWF
jgi:hypothetical protein